MDSFCGSIIPSNDYLHSTQYYPDAPSLKCPESPNNRIRTEWLLEAVPEARKSKLKEKDDAKPKESVAMGKEKSANKEAKRRSLREKRESVQEWLKNVQEEFNPALNAGPSANIGSRDTESPVLEEQLVRRAGRERKKERIDSESRSLVKVCHGNPDVDNLILDPLHGLDTSLGQSDTLQSRITHQDIMMDALFGVMKRVDDLESQLELTNSRSTGTNVGNANADMFSIGTTRATGHRALSFLRDSMETSHWFGEHLARDHARLTQVHTEDINERQGRMEKKESVNAGRMEMGSSLMLAQHSDSTVNQSRERIILSSHSEWASQQGGIHLEGNITERETQEPVANLISYSKAKSIERSQKSLAEEMTSAEESQRQEMSGLWVERHQESHTDDAKEENGGVLVLSEDEDIDIVDVDSEGTFEVVEYGEGDSVVAVENEKEDESTRDDDDDDSSVYIV
ncbi:hypothetical protein BDP27DRAFT_1310004 [Rhodocollybia butyracea]|uniref:Uncharacterized protein n=1 Tax=Rhodocollybia butyracea TaxID=206335 RepID=A0A9P5QBX1_9AGAR|nr:hypothetical protein BDP27DRAFT_1310004 [Rhodocollybia butyracea]